MRLLLVIFNHCISSNLTTNWFGFVLFSKSSCLILKTIFDYWHFRLKQNFSQFIAKIMSSHEPLLPPWFLTYLLPAKWFLKNTTTSSMMMVLRKKSRQWFHTGWCNDLLTLKMEPSHFPQDAFQNFTWSWLYFSMNL